jgi:hypothetical protein
MKAELLMHKTNRLIPPENREKCLRLLQQRFEKNVVRYQGLEWREVLAKLEQHPGKLWSLYEMERTGGEPDVVGRDETTDELIFFDCAPESPQGRRSLCYDQEAWEARKANRPAGSAMAMAAEMGIDLLTEAQYIKLQELGKFDTKTTSWIKAAAEVRELGGAIFGDRRYGRVFIYHNGAQSYYAARGFRGVLRV